MVRPIMRRRSVPEIANLAGDEPCSIVAAGTGYPPVFINRYRIDRERLAALFGQHLDDMLALLASYRGDNASVIRAREEARTWLDERRAEQWLFGSSPGRAICP